jgi:single-stranded-DNA-specific exonuclease
MVADVVPLLDENRIFVRHGLARLKQAASPGLQALLEVAGQTDRPEVTAEAVSFHLAPRLNAAGRLGCARLVVELLCTNLPHKAMELARFLDRQNQDRQTLERRILGEARRKLVEEGHEHRPAIVLADANWHPGVIGIVAGRLAEQYGKPTLLVAFRESGIGQGSGRSVADFPLHEALRDSDDLLLTHGGHAAAAGFKVVADKLDAFRERFCTFVAARVAGPVPPRLVLEAEVPLSAITHGFVEAVEHLEPYGAGNPRPKLLVGPVQVVGEPRKVGNGERHLQFRVRQQGTVVRCIAFNHGDRAEELMSAEGVCCLAATPSFNLWHQFKDVQLEIYDFQPGDRATLV